MNNIITFQQLFESAPRIPRLNKRGMDYWKNKGKNGKDVMVYFHDDMDGIFSAVVVKERLIELGYNIKGYGVVNYQEGWKNTHLDPKMINVVVDFANMPPAKDKDLIDVYIDHHGEFSEEEKEFYKDNPVIKTKTASAYEGICRVIGKPLDSILLYAIDMIDSAKYDDYNVKWTDILNFNWDLFKEISNRKGTLTIQPFKASGDVEIGWSTVAKLTFAGAFNQYLKRGDHKTLIETVSNLKNVSIYNIYNVMKKLYPKNNVWFSGYSKGQEKEFLSDGQWRIGTMQKKTRGSGNKIYNNQQEFIKDTKSKPNGYKIIGKLMFVPSGTWANALRARAILEQDYIDGVIPEEHQVDFIILQYGNTIQICGFHKIEDTENLPVLKNGETIDDLGAYMTGLLKNFQTHFGYYEPDTTIGQDELTVSGGHVGIGTISGIVGKVDAQRIEDNGKEITKIIEVYNGYRYLDLIKNKIINDLSGVEWKIGMKWADDDEESQGQGMLIRNILNNDKEIQDKIALEISQLDNPKNIHQKSAAERRIKSEYRDKLTKLGKEELIKKHDAAMLDHKVMKKKDIRKLDQHGKVVENHTPLKVCSYKEYTSIKESWNEWN
tara:strand:- start:21185 stop:23002 length:1818 start_codon:yes stop_codon:yes gene_type:complete